MNPRAARVRELISANLIHHASQLKIDIFVAGGTPLDQQQLARRIEVTVDILLQKLRWF